MYYLLAVPLACRNHHPGLLLQQTGSSYLCSFIAMPVAPLSCHTAASTLLFVFEPVVITPSWPLQHSIKLVKIDGKASNIFQLFNGAAAARHRIASIKQAHLVIIALGSRCRQRIGAYTAA
jgi:hypothetical protein